MPSVHRDAGDTANRYFSSKGHALLEVTFDHTGS